jgi:hypothetical protein
MTDISDAELQAITTVSEAATKAGLAGAHGDELPPKGSFLKLIGADDASPVNSLGIISVADYTATVQTWQIKQRPPGGGDPTDRLPTLIETGAHCPHEVGD